MGLREGGQHEHGYQSEGIYEMAEEKSLEGGVPHRERFARVKELWHMGFNVVPLGIRTKITPYKWKAFQTERVTEDDLDGWYSRENERNWALLQGAISGTVTVEGDDEDALRLLTERCPNTAIKQKSRKGEHWVYRYPGGHVGNKTKITVNGTKYNLDLKGDGGFIVAPLSVHPTGHVYHEIVPWTPELIRAAPVFDPQWLDLHLDHRNHERPEWDDDHEDVVDDPDLPPVGERVEAARRWLDAQAGAKQGQGDGGADRYCFALAMKLLWGFALPRAEAKDLLWEWGQRSDNVDDHGHWYPWDHQQVNHKIEDAARREYDGRPGDKLPQNWHLAAQEEVEKLFASKAPAALAAGAEDTTTILPVSATGIPNSNIEQPLSVPKGVAFESWDQTCTIAAGQREDWLIPHWAEFGCLHILTGAPFSGKSSIVAEIVASMATGRPFCDLPVQQVPLLVLDLENKERIIVKRIKNALTGDPGVLGDLWHRVNPTNIPRPLTNNFIVNCIETIKEITSGSEKGLVLIDTMRSAFAGSGKKENDNDDMAAILYPLQMLAQKTGWAVLLLHHNNKTSGHFSGAGVIAGAADYLWNWTSDKAKLIGQLAMDGGRDDHQHPLEFKYDMGLQRNVFLGRTPDRLAAETKERTEHDLARWLVLLPTDPAKAVDKEYLRTEGVKLRLLDAGVQPKTHTKIIERWTQEAVNGKYCGFVGSGGRSDPYRYYRTASGSAVVDRHQGVVG